MRCREDKDKKEVSRSPDGEEETYAEKDARNRKTDGGEGMKEGGGVQWFCGFCAETSQVVLSP